MNVKRKIKFTRERGGMVRMSYSDNGRLDKKHSRYNPKPDTKGWSKTCYGGQHKECKNSKGNCTCPCHNTGEKKCSIKK